MSNDKLTADDGVLIGRNHWDVPVRVELRAYLRFTRCLDNQLRRLVVRWAHTASPKARGEPAERR
jgi:hypothetical protein